MSEFIHIADVALDIKVFNRDFILLRCDDKHSHYMGLVADSIFKEQFSFITEVIHTEKEVLLKLNEGFNYTHLQKINSLKLESFSQSRCLIWPVYFDGPDWEEVCEQTKLDKNLFVTQLCQKEYSVAMLGFLPGFIYGKSLDKSLHIPRKASPVKKVEAGTFAIAEKYIGLYSLPSPGGWHRLGMMPCRVINFPALPPVLMRLTDRIKVQEINKMEYEYILDKNLDILEYNELD